MALAMANLPSLTMAQALAMGNLPSLTMALAMALAMGPLPSLTMALAMGNLPSLTMALAMAPLPSLTMAQALALATGPCPTLTMALAMALALVLAGKGAKAAEHLPSLVMAPALREHSGSREGGMVKRRYRHLPRGRSWRRLVLQVSRCGMSSPQVTPSSLRQLEWLVSRRTRDMRKG